MNFFAVHVGIRKTAPEENYPENIFEIHPRKKIFFQHFSNFFLGGGGQFSGDKLPLKLYVSILLEMLKFTISEI